MEIENTYKCKDTLEMFNTDNTYLEIKFTDFEIDKIRQAANERNLSLNEYIVKSSLGEI